MGGGRSMAVGKTIHICKATLIHMHFLFAVFVICMHSDLFVGRLYDIRSSNCFPSLSSAFSCHCKKSNILEVCLLCESARSTLTKQPEFASIHLNPRCKITVWTTLSLLHYLSLPSFPLSFPLLPLLKFFLK